jgi:hypothetical protein
MLYPEMFHSDLQVPDATRLAQPRPAEGLQQRLLESAKEECNEKEETPI